MHQIEYILLYSMAQHPVKTFKIIVDVLVFSTRARTLSAQEILGKRQEVNLNFDY